MRLWGARTAILALLVLLFWASASRADGWGAPSVPPFVSATGKATCPGGGPKCIAVGWDDPDQEAVALVSNDSGVNWSGQKIPGARYLDGIACTDSNHCWAAGWASSGNSSPGAVVQTTDGGQSWQSDSLPAGVYGLRRISCVGSSCWAVGPNEGSNVVATHDGGHSWSVTQANPCNAALCPGYTFEDVTFLSGQVGLAVGGDQCGGQGVTECSGAIFRTTDGGASWKNVSPSGLPFGAAVTCADSTRCWVAANTFSAGRVSVSFDAGQTWEPQQLPQASTEFALNDISCTGAPSACWAVGQSSPQTGSVGVAFDTTTGGSSWQLDNPYTATPALYGVSATPSDFALATGPQLLRQSVTTPGPFDRIGFFTFSDTHHNPKGACTGTVIAGAANQSVILVAGHCVTDTPGSCFTDFAFAPGHTGSIPGTNPWGIWNAADTSTCARVFMDYNWPMSGDHRVDYAFIVMNSQNGVPIAQAVGGIPISFNPGRKQGWTAYGYPGGVTSLQNCSDDHSGDYGDDQTYGPRQMTLFCPDFAPGASGGPWINNQNGLGYAIGAVNSTHGTCYLGHIGGCDQIGTYLGSEASASFAQAATLQGSNIYDYVGPAIAINGGSGSVGTAANPPVSCVDGTVTTSGLRSSATDSASRRAGIVIATGITHVRRRNRARVIVRLTKQGQRILKPGHKLTVHVTLRLKLANGRHRLLRGTTTIVRHRGAPRRHDARAVASRFTC